MIARRRSGILLPVLFIAVCGALVWLIHGQLQEPAGAHQSPAKSDAPPPQFADLPEDVDFVMPPMAAFDGIVARPIFSPTRRPGANQAPVIVSENLGLAIMGLSITASGRVALFRPQDGGESLRLREGEDYRGWVLTRIDPNRVVFSRDGDEQQLELDYEKPPEAKKKSRRDRRRARKNSQQQQQKAAKKTRRKNSDRDDEDDELDEEN